MDTRNELIAQQWTALAERCEKATGADREIDRAIIAVLGYSWRGMAYWDNETSERTLEGSVFYTRSLDAIAALIQREFANFALTISVGPEISAVRLCTPGTSEIGVAGTEVLARCAAFCRAMAAKVAT